MWAALAPSPAVADQAVAVEGNLEGAAAANHQAIPPAAGAQGLAKAKEDQVNLQAMWRPGEEDQAKADQVLAAMAKAKRPRQRQLLLGNQGLFRVFSCLFRAFGLLGLASPADRRPQHDFSRQITITEPEACCPH